MIRLLIFIFFLSACAGKVIITPKGCQTEAVWGEHSRDDHFVYQMHVWGEEIRWEELLIRKGIFCSNLVSVSITIRHTMSDVFWNLIPGVTSRTVEISGKVKDQNIFRDELPPLSEDKKN